VLAPTADARTHARTPRAFALHTHRRADKTVFPKQDVVGWYCTGKQLEQQHMAVHRRVSVGGWPSRAWVCSVCLLLVPQPCSARCPRARMPRARTVPTRGRGRGNARGCLTWLAWLGHTR
jgi:hypothetical protein